MTVDPGARTRRSPSRLTRRRGRCATGPCAGARSLGAVVEGPAFGHQTAGPRTGCVGAEHRRRRLAARPRRAGGGAEGGRRRPHHRRTDPTFTYEGRCAANAGGAGAPESVEGNAAGGATPAGGAVADRHRRRADPAVAGVRPGDAALCGERPAGGERCASDRGGGRPRGAAGRQRRPGGERGAVGLRRWRPGPPRGRGGGVGGRRVGVVPVD